MPSESQYEQAVLSLQGGINLVDEALNTNRGNLSNCLNFEGTDRLGYSRIKGYEKYDQGPYNSSSIYTNTVIISGSEFDDFVQGEAVIVVDATYKDGNKTLGYFLDTFVMQSGDSLQIWGLVVITDYKAFLSLVPTVSELLGGTSATTLTFNAAKSFTNNGGVTPNTTAKDDMESLNALFYADNVDREAPNVTAGSTLGNNPITGLHWYKEHEYAITDYLTFDFTDGEVEVFAGDVLTDVATGLITARVINIAITSGTIAGEDAAGTVLLKLIAGEPSGPMEVERTGGAVTALDITGLSTAASTGAGLWRSLDSGGWEEVGLGYEFPFYGGTSNGPPPVFSRGSGNATSNPIDATSEGTTGTATSWAQVGSPSSIADALAGNDTKYLTYSSSLAAPAVFVQIKDFPSALNIPADSEITGITLTIVGEGLSTPARLPYWLAVPINNTGEIGEGKTVGGFGDTTGTGTAVTLGGPEDLWGIADIRTALTNGFGFNIAPRQVQGGSSVQWLINQVQLTVHYTVSVDTYYFWNGVDDVQAPITNFYLDSGAWADNDAHGRMQVASITPVSPSVRTYIGAGDEIRTGPGGTGALIAVVESNAVYAYLPSLKDLLDHGSRYQLITANFYGNEAWETIYGVSGAGQAFAYDGYYFRRIYTGLSPDLDTPRHIAYHQGSLALGYAAGNVTLSVPGNPENYSGILGAVSIDTGDPVTGLLRMNGTSLGVFCRGSIGTIVGTNIDNYAYTILSPAEGAIEYTAQNMGEPVFCSNKGITTLSQTAAYGDFLGSPLSEAVTPWLLPRVQRTRSPIDGNFVTDNAAKYSAGVGIAFATVCRSSNQYRLIFEDGTCLTMTLRGAQKTPEFTIQQYDRWTTPPDIEDAVKYSKFIPLACSSVIDNSGRERLHISHYNPTADAEAEEIVYYVYEQELSWTFGGMPIPYSLRLNENFFGNPFRKTTVAKVAVHGLSLGYAPLRISLGTEYGEPLATERASPYISMPRTPTSGIAQDPRATMNIAPGVSTGEARSFNINLFNPLTGDGDVCPPFSVQMLLIQYKEGKGDV